MANLKADLLNELRNQKYYAEMELLRLAQDPSMNYRKKILDIDIQLGSIALMNQKIGLAEGYFQNPEEAQPPVPNVPVEAQVPNVPVAPVPEAPAVEVKPEAPAVEVKPVVNKPQPGQSHGE
jgi:hypothetical protein